MKLTKVLFLVTLVFIFFSGCETYKNIPYFKDVPDSTRISVQSSISKELFIQQGDILSVNIQTIDPDANMIFSQMPGITTQASVLNNLTNVPATLQQNISGYVVNNKGIIDLPLIGKVNVSGLTTAVAADTIQQRVAQLYKLPVVVVRFANLRVSVIGEVLRPGTYILPNEKNTIFDALALSGDLTIFAKRENALLIRDSLGHQNFIRFSLNSKDLVKQDFFYLRQNDVIYIEPGKSKAASLDASKSRNYAIAASILSLLVVVATRVK